MIYQNTNHQSTQIHFQQNYKFLIYQVNISLLAMFYYLIGFWIVNILQQIYQQNQNQHLHKIKYFYHYQSEPFYLFLLQQIPILPQQEGDSQCFQQIPAHQNLLKKFPQNLNPVKIIFIEFVQIVMASMHLVKTLGHQDLQTPSISLKIFHKQVCNDIINNCTYCKSRDLIKV